MEWDAQSSLESLRAIATLHTYTEGVGPILQVNRVCDLLVPRIIEVKYNLDSPDLIYALWSIARLPSSVSLRDELLPVILSRCDDFIEEEGVVEIFADLVALPGLDDKLVDYFFWAYLDIAKDLSREYLEAPEDFQDGHLASYIDALCAFAKLKVADHPLVDVAAMLPWKLSLLGDWELCALIRAYQQLDPTCCLADFLPRQIAKGSYKTEIDSRRCR